MIIKYNNSLIKIKRVFGQGYSFWIGYNGIVTQTRLSENYFLFYFIYDNMIYKLEGSSYHNIVTGRNIHTTIKITITYRLVLYRLFLFCIRRNSNVNKI